MNNVEEIRNYCLSKKDVSESLPFGPDVLVFKVNTKVFLLLPLNQKPIQFNVKCDPELAIELRAQYDCVIPGYHMNKKHWNTIIVDGSVSQSLIKSWINDSYELVNKTNKKRSKIK
jgi:predicted DNA-binding protein (MmcQ/YjbR family)